MKVGRSGSEREKFFLLPMQQIVVEWSSSLAIYSLRWGTHVVINVMDLVAKMGAETERCHQAYSNHRGKRYAFGLPFARLVFHSFCPSTLSRNFGAC
jgi:hypothetical protein